MTSGKMWSYSEPEKKNELNEIKTREDERVGVPVHLFILQNPIFGSMGTPVSL